jgi:hypothetical protein
MVDTKPKAMRARGRQGRVGSGYQGNGERCLYPGLDRKPG